MQYRQFDTNLILVLDVLLQENSVALAAEKLGRSPSAVSHALSRLRQIFNDDLFVRSGQGLQPTHRAEMIKADVRELVTRIEHFIADIEGYEPL